MMTNLTPGAVEAHSFVYITLLVYVWLCWASVAAWASLWLRRAWATVSWWRSGSTLCWLLLWSTGSRARGLSAVAARGLCGAQDAVSTGLQGSAVAVQGLCGAQDAVSTGLPGSAVAVQGLSCSQACGIFLDQGLNLCFLQRQANSLPLNHQGNLKPVL